MSGLSKAPIGIFDSGIGGLTVAQAVMERLPSEDILYFGDTARVPYGIKSVQTVKQYAMQITDFLVKKNVKLILIACNTVSAAANEEVRSKSGNAPVMGVIEAGAEAAVSVTGPGKNIGVIGTLATIGSGEYEKQIHNLNKDFGVFSRACPLLVPLAEEGWTDNEIARLTLNTYLKDFSDKNLGSLILGCTHYPLFKPLIRQVLPVEGLQVIDSAVSIAQKAEDYLTEKNLLNTGNIGRLSCYVSDRPQRFQQLAERFLGRPLNRVEVVNWD